MIEAHQLTKRYGEKTAVDHLDFVVQPGAVTGFLGPNGAGKSTLLRAISRFDAQITGGRVTFDGTDLAGLAAERIVARGLSHVPEGRQLFSELTVDDNIRLGAYARRGPVCEADVQAMYARFSPLAQRRHVDAFSLSGGEQQMLAIARALMARPKLLMLDEPSTGLAPQIVTQIFAIIGELRTAGTAVLLVEQNAYLTLQYADRAYVLEDGAVALAGAASDLARDVRVAAIYLGGAINE